MKPRILVFTIALLASFAAAAQSTNPLNYSGRMYVEAIEIIATPRYVSYEDHAILSQQMRIPSVEITKCDMAFEKGTVTVKDNEMKMKVNGCKKYDTDYGWSLHNSLDTSNCIDALKSAITRHGAPEIINSDQGYVFQTMVGH